MQISLVPVRYEFATVAGNEWDDNWLIIDGRVTTPGDDWSFREPVLTTFEALGLATWLERVANRSEPCLPAGFDDDNPPSLDFVEPNLAFGVSAYRETSATIQVYLSLEALSPALRADLRIGQYWVELTMPLDGIARAAATWRNELSAFPSRTAL